MKVARGKRSRFSVYLTSLLVLISSVVFQISSTQSANAGSVSVSLTSAMCTPSATSISCEWTTVKGASGTKYVIAAASQAAPATTFQHPLHMDLAQKEELLQNGSSLVPKQQPLITLLGFKWHHLQNWYLCRFVFYRGHQRAATVVSVATTSGSTSSDNLRQSGCYYSTKWGINFIHKWIGDFYNSLRLTQLRLDIHSMVGLHKVQEDRKLQMAVIRQPHLMEQ
jgi:hypothetical protein